MPNPTLVIHTHSYQRRGIVSRQLYTPSKARPPKASRIPLQLFPRGKLIARVLAPGAVVNARLRECIRCTPYSTVLNVHVRARRARGTAAGARAGTHRGTVLGYLRVRAGSGTAARASVHGVGTRRVGARGTRCSRPVPMYSTHRAYVEHACRQQHGR